MRTINQVNTTVKNSQHANDASAQTSVKKLLLKVLSDRLTNLAFKSFADTRGKLTGLVLKRTPAQTVFLLNSAGWLS